MTPQASRGNLGATMLGHDVTVWQGVSVEIILTFFLVFTVFSTLDPGRRQSGFGVPLSIGVAVVACHIVGVSSVVLIASRMFHEFDLLRL